MKQWLQRELNDTMDVGAEGIEAAKSAFSDMGADVATAAKAAAIWVGSGIASQSLRAVQAAKPHAKWAAMKVFNEICIQNFFDLDTGKINNWREWAPDGDAPRKGRR